MKRIIGVGALLAVLATEVHRWLLPGNHIGLLVMVLLACVATALLAPRVQGLLDGPRAPATTGPGASRRRRPSKTRSSRPTAPDGPREGGEVKWFSREKGFGFIVRDNGDEIFVHHRSIRNAESRRANLRDGERVTFVAVERSKGWQAEDVAAEHG